MSDVNLTAAQTGEFLQIGPTQMYIIEDGSRSDNRIGSALSVLPPSVSGPPLHRHLMHDETFLVTAGVLRFILDGTYLDAKAGDYVVVPIGAPHTFANQSDAPVEFFSSFTPSFYVNYFRELARLSAEGRFTPEVNLEVMLRYATQPVDGS